MTKQTGSSKSREKALKLVDLSKCGPVGALNEYSQRIGSPFPTYQYSSVLLHDNETARARGIENINTKTGIARKWWRCIAISSVTGTTYSSLPIHGDIESTKNDSHFAAKDGHIYFKSKKSAQRAVAIAMLTDMLEFKELEEKMKTSGKEYHSDRPSSKPDNCGDTSIRSDVCDKSQPSKFEVHELVRENVQSTPSNTEVSNENKSRKFRRRPLWVKTLQECGVDPSSLQIRFEQHLDNLRNNVPTYGAKFTKESVSEITMLSKYHPTLICCIIVIEVPISITLKSKPFASKIEAVENVVFLLVSALKKEVDERSMRRHADYILNKYKPDGSTDDKQGESEVIEQLWNKCTSVSVTSYFFSPPEFATFPIRFPSVSSNTDPCTKTVLYLYEVQLLHLSRELVNFGGESPFLSTKLGLLFAKDLPIFSGYLNKRRGINSIDVPVKFPNTCIENQSSHNGNENGLKGFARFTKVEDICFFATDTPKLQMAISLQRILENPKIYGKSQQHSCFKNQPFTTSNFMKNLKISDRTYLAVPLVLQNDINKKLIIDWTLVKNIVENNCKPYLQPVDKYFWRVPSLLSSNAVKDAYLSSNEAVLFFLLIAGAAISPRLSQLVQHIFFNTRCWRISFHDIIVEFQTEISITEAIITSISLIMAIFASILGNYPPQILTFNGELRNRFIYQVHSAGRYLYIVRGSCCQNIDTWNKFLTPMNAKSKFPSEDYTSYADYYYKKWGMVIRYKTRNLIPVKGPLDTVILDEIGNVEKTPSTSSNASARENMKEELTYVIPEFIRVLPMPRDFFYSYRTIRSSLLAFERCVTLYELDARMEEFENSYIFKDKQSICKRSGVTTSDASFIWCSIRRHNYSRLSLLEDATTLFPCVAYEQLEHVGDVVLGYFVAINLFARNTYLKWDSDDLGYFKSLAVRNSALYHAASQIGLSSVCWKGMNKWTSAYTMKFQNPTINISTACNTSMANNSFHSSEISDKQLSDILEALLGTAFLAESDEIVGTGRMVVALLNELNLPLPNQRKTDTTKDSGNGWFCAPGPCLLDGYLFDQDLTMKKEIRHIEEIFNINKGVSVILRRGMHELLNYFSKINAISHDYTLKGITHLCEAEVIFCCALFDDNLEETESSESDKPQVVLSSRNVEEDMLLSQDMPGLIRAAMFRENLFFVGNAALHLCICLQVYCNFPDSSPGDLHLLKTCVISDDVLAYITIKNRIHKCLYDSNAPEISEFLEIISIADAKGEKRWAKRGGWILDGGVDEFVRRMRFFFPWLTCTSNISEILTKREVRPMYVGLSGGCLYGNKTKIASKFTEDLAFSLKSIIGALVLNIGLDQMWKCVLPLFAELMLLSPADIRREYGNISNICLNYQKGRSLANRDQFRKDKHVGWSAT